MVIEMGEEEREYKKLFPPDPKREYRIYKYGYYKSLIDV